MNLILIGTIASLLAGLATAVGGLAVFFVRKLTDKFLDFSLGFAAGVMLAVTSFCLTLRAIEIGGIYKTSFGIFLGALFFIFIEKFTPHRHEVVGVKGPPAALSRVWLFILAMSIHNFPEGLAVGVGFGGGDMNAGRALALGIGLQNIPEGLAVAFPLMREKSSRIKAFTVALLTGLVEPVGGFLGIWVVSIGKFLLPYGLAFAAGAMLFVISEEMIPETHTRGNARVATVGIILGFIAMMILDNIFG